VEAVAEVLRAHTLAITKAEVTPYARELLARAAARPTPEELAFLRSEIDPTGVLRQ
jgi:hypothetical protein